MRHKKNEKYWIRNILISTIGLAIAVAILQIAPDYRKTEITDKINLIINNNNVTASLKRDVLSDEKGVIYVSKQDIDNFFDNYIYYDEKYDQIITTSDTKVATLPLDKKVISVNGSQEKRILGGAIKQDDTYYLPFSEMEEVYNIEIEHIKDDKIERVVVTSLDRELKKADVSKDINVKWKMKDLSRTLEKIKKGEKVVLIKLEKDGWARIRTSSGIIGYVKQNDLTNIITVRETMEKDTRINGKVSLVWDDYYNANVPDRMGQTIPGINVISPSFFRLARLGKGEINDRATNGGKNYVSWAKTQGYKVWAMFTNDSQPETTHEILNDYKLREKTIQNLLTLAVEYGVDGINLDFENMYEEDKDLYTRFVVELYPRLHEYGMNLSVDVTAPDGSPMWSLCFDRYDLSKNCDYLIFMAYDQYSVGSKRGGSTAGLDWVKVNIDKFLRDIEPEKIILANPFYTRAWKVGEEKDEPTTVNMNRINNVLPENAKITWLEEEKQNYAEYTKNGSNYKMWIEDEKSMTERLNLCIEKNLAGVAFWQKGFETNEIWNLIKEKILD